MNQIQSEQYKTTLKKVKEAQEDISEAFIHLNLKIELEKSSENIIRLKNVSGVLAAQAIYTREIIEKDNFLNNEYELIEKTLQNILDTCQSIMSL